MDNLQKIFAYEIIEYYFFDTCDLQLKFSCVAVGDLKKTYTYRPSCVPDKWTVVAVPIRSRN